MCPSYGQFGLGNGYAGQQYSMTYSFNVYSQNPAFCGGKLPAKPSLPLAEIKDPSSKIQAIDLYYGGNPSCFINFTGFFYPEHMDGYITKSDTAGSAHSNHAVDPVNHNQGRNALYFDGHVKWLSNENLRAAAANTTAFRPNLD